MAITKCKECGGEMSTKADACPKCGAKPRRLSGCLLVILVVILGFVVLALVAPFVDKRGDAPASAASPSRTADPRTKVSPYVFEADDKANFPKLARKLGSSWFRLQSVREAAAVHVATSGKCDYVEVAEASDRSTSEDIVIFVDCRNGQRMYVSESSLGTGQAGQFQSEKTISRAAAIKACSESAKSMTTHPELADMHIWSGSSFSTNKTTGNAQVLLDFDAKSSFGVEGKFTARCIFPADGKPLEIKILPR